MRGIRSGGGYSRDRSSRSATGRHQRCPVRQANPAASRGRGRLGISTRKWRRWSRGGRQEAHGGMDSGRDDERGGEAVNESLSRRGREPVRVRRLGSYAGTTEPRVGSCGSPEAAEDSGPEDDQIESDRRRGGADHEDVISREARPTRDDDERVVDGENQGSPSRRDMQPGAGRPQRQRDQQKWERVEQGLDNASEPPLCPRKGQADPDSVMQGGKRHHHPRQTRQKSHLKRPVFPRRQLQPAGCPKTRAGGPTLWRPLAFRVTDRCAPDGTRELTGRGQQAD